MPATPASSFVIAVLCMRQHCCIFKFLGYPSLCDTHNGSAACRWWTHLPAPVHPYTAALPQHPQLLQFGCGLWRGKGFGTCSAPWHPAPCCAQRPAAAFGASMVAFIETWAIDTGSCALRQAPGAQLGRAQTCRQPRYRRRPAAMAAWRFSDWYQNNGIRKWQTWTQPSQRETITGCIVLYPAVSRIQTESLAVWGRLKTSSFMRQTLSGSAISFVYYILRDSSLPFEPLWWGQPYS